MEFDIKEKAAELMTKVTSDEDLKKEFLAKPVETVEKLLGVQLPEEQMKQVVTAIKAKIGKDSLTNLTGGAKSAGGLFGIW